MKVPARRLALLLVFVLSAAIAPARAGSAGPDGKEVDDEDRRPGVELIWMSMANWYFKIGDLRIMMDGYFTRVPGPPFFFGGGGGFKNTIAPFPVNVPSILRVSQALDAEGSLDYLIAGHSHFDHTFDTATWSALTHAPIIGGLSTCLQAQAEGLPASQCINVKGGERLRLTDDVTLYVVRWNHSGSHAANPEQHDPVELSAPPIPDPVNGGLRGGVAEDFPNGGGGGCSSSPSAREPGSAASSSTTPPAPSI